MMPHIAGIPDETRMLLSTLVRPKFEAYFQFTQSCLRSKLLDNGLHLYPDDSMVSDLNFLWVVFADVREIAKPQLTNIVENDPFLKRQFYRILEGDDKDPDGQFWHKPKDQPLSRIPLKEAVDSHLSNVFRTLRNGFAHTHWLYHNLSALDYWEEQGWDTDAPPRFRASQTTEKELPDIRRRRGQVQCASFLETERHADSCHSRPLTALTPPPLSQFSSHWK